MSTWNTMHENDGKEPPFANGVEPPKPGSDRQGRIGRVAVIAFCAVVWVVIALIVI